MPPMFVIKRATSVTRNRGCLREATRPLKNQDIGAFAVYVMLIYATRSATFRSSCNRSCLRVTASRAGAITLRDAEREHIWQALETPNWMVGGPSGAAARLGIKRTTLQSMMSRLGIERPGRRLNPEEGLTAA